MMNSATEALYVTLLTIFVYISSTIVLPRPKPPEIVEVGEKSDARQQEEMASLDFIQQQMKINAEQERKLQKVDRDLQTILKVAKDIKRQIKESSGENNDREQD